MIPKFESFSKSSVNESKSDEKYVQKQLDKLDKSKSIYATFDDRDKETSAMKIDSSLMKVLHNWLGDELKESKVNEGKSDEKYYVDQLNKIDPNSEYPPTFQFSGSGKKTNYMDLNADSAKVLKQWLEDNFGV